MEAAEELRRLRARAYGPDADIADDPVALARLEELESASAVRTPVPPAPPDPVSPVSFSAPDETADAEAGDVPGAASPPAEPPAVRRGIAGWRSWSRRRTAIVAAVVLVAAVVVAVGATTFVTRRTGYTAPVAAVLVPTPGREVPSIFGAPNEESVVFADFGGFTPIASRMSWNGAAEEACLMIAETEHLDDATSNSFSGALYYGCGAGPFPATITLAVGPDAPEAMRERYPEGSSLQFILEDDEVVVLAATEGSGTPAPAESVDLERTLRIE